MNTPQKQLIGLILVTAAASAAYRLVYWTGAERTSALYVGVPAVLAIGLALIPRSGSATGMLLKGSALAVLMACIILPEGLICMLFVLPLIGAVSVIVGTAIDYGRERRNRRRDGPMIVAVAIPLLILSMEGLVGSPFERRDSAESAITVDATPEEVRAALAATPRFDVGVPTFLKLGFNRPVGATGSGLAVGDTRVVEFTGGTHDDHPLKLFGLTGESGGHHHRSHQHLRVVASSERHAVFAVEQDTTMLARWADLNRAVVTWAPTADGRTKVTWRLDYERLIHPAFYFAPLQRFGMTDVADYLLHAVVADAL